MEVLSDGERARAYDATDDPSRTNIGDIAPRHLPRQPACGFVLDDFDAKA